MKQSSLLLTAAALIGGSALLIWGAIALRSDSGPDAVAAVPSIVADDHVRGAAASSVVVVEYFDFECPACAAYAPVVDQLVDEYGERVTFVARNFPLAQHTNGVAAALAAEAAAAQGRYWEMHDLLFARQKEWSGKPAATPEAFEAYALELGLDMDRFRADVANPQTRARIERDFTDGQRIGVNSTPTFFLNGVKLRNPNSIDVFRQFLDAELAKVQPVSVVGATTSATFTIPQ
jgi:protein-disulfide isomerase